MKDLKERAIRGAVAKVFAQATNFTIRVGSLVVLARLLSPGDFGIIGMVTALTGVFNLFKDFGLSAATVQRPDVTDEQISTLFWFNIVFGAALASFLIVMAPVVVRFYHEPRLLWVTIVLATAFIFNAAGVQHSALLQRQMRFTALARVDVISLVVSTSIGLSMAVLGFKYWALVAAAVSLPLVTTFGLWLTTGWIPGRPRARVGLRSMMHFGSTLTLISIIIYIAYNSDKVLLGRFWGAAVLGIYGRAFQLINIPTDNLNSAVGEVAFSALSRVQDDAASFKNYFLKSYSLVLALTIPITIAVALFAPDLIFILLGPKWKEAVPIFRLLAPTILVFALINPIGWLMFSLGMVGRSLKASLVFAPTVIASYAIAMRYGPKAVAFAYSAVMILWAVPLIAWGIHGTVVSLRDIALVASRPLLSGMIAAPIALGVGFWCGRSLSPFPRLLLEGSALVSAYAGMLLYAMGQKTFYLDLLKALTSRRPVESIV
jgi:O-antigen/teichoic acid export membrane protein